MIILPRRFRKNQQEAEQPIPKTLRENLEQLNQQQILENLTDEEAAMLGALPKETVQSIMDKMGIAR